MQQKDKLYSCVLRWAELVVFFPRWSWWRSSCGHLPGNNGRLYIHCQLSHESGWRTVPGEHSQREPPKTLRYSLGVPCLNPPAPYLTITLSDSSTVCGLSACLVQLIDPARTLPNVLLCWQTFALLLLEGQACHSASEYRAYCELLSSRVLTCADKLHW